LNEQPEIAKDTAEAPATTGFALPNPLLGEPWESMRRELGATLSTDAEANEHVALNMDSFQLPMQVWLRGDEPYCGEFTLDPEHVMQQLGIRRSRLTQISGRELRVGKIRRDRYVRPVYRQIDVEEYAAQCRATVSAQRTASVLDSATARLAETTAALPRRIEELLDSRLNALMNVMLSELTARLRSDFAAAVSAQTEELKGEIEQSALNLSTRVGEVEEIFAAAVLDAKEQMAGLASSAHVEAERAARIEQVQNEQPSRIIDLVSRQITARTADLAEATRREMRSLGAELAEQQTLTAELAAEIDSLRNLHAPVGRPRRAASRQVARLALIPGSVSPATRARPRVRRPSRHARTFT